MWGVLALGQQLCPLPVGQEQRGPGEVQGTKPPGAPQSWEVPAETCPLSPDRVEISEPGTGGSHSQQLLLGRAEIVPRWESPSAGLESVPVLPSRLCPRP